MGLIGVGTMGSALALNIADNGHNIALYNLDASTIDALIAEAGALAPKLTKTESVAELVAAMTPPRAIILLVPAGGPVDASIDALLPHLAPGDTIIDGGNSDLRATQRRTAHVQAARFHSLGVGVAGCADGARRGPWPVVGLSHSARDPQQPVT